jgi:diguanylate cyclase (GGDEF)-like protein
MMTDHDVLCVAVLDLDFFKHYNDTRGHLAGDTLLADLGRSWLPQVRPQDLLVRWGGEEFALALPQCTMEDAREVLERLRASLPDGQTASAGLASWDGTESIEALMSRADAALYEAKNHGRDRIATAVSA